MTDCVNLRYCTPDWSHITCQLARWNQHLDLQDKLFVVHVSAVCQKTLEQVVLASS